jgi:hypothetical protein
MLMPWLPQGKPGLLLLVLLLLLPLAHQLDRQSCST